MKRKSILLLTAVIVFFTLTSSQCVDNGAKSASGVQKATATVNTDMNGNTVEQKNVMERIKRDNMPGSIKHLYILSAYSGQVIIYSTVTGKVTSGNKRLNPSTVRGDGGWGFKLFFGDDVQYTSEVLGDDGAYGSSGDYIFWFDSKGVYHQHYVTGGQIIHVSDQPLVVKNVIINMEAVNEK